MYEKSVGDFRVYSEMLICSFMYTLNILLRKVVRT